MMTAFIPRNPIYPGYKVLASANQVDCTPLDTRGGVVSFGESDNLNNTASEDGQWKATDIIRDNGLLNMIFDADGIDKGLANLEGLFSGDLGSIENITGLSKEEQEQLWDYITGRQNYLWNKSLQKDAQAWNDFQNSLDRIFTRKMNVGNMKFTAKENEIARAYNSAEAKLQRAWLENMSNTAIQRQTADYKKAGLNPYLAYSAGGAPVGNADSASTSPANYSAKTVSGRSVGANHVNDGSLGNIISSLINMIGYTANGVLRIFSR